MKKVFIVHGFEGEPNGGWRPWLMGELAKNDVYACALSMPSPDQPICEEWVEEIRRHVDRNQGDEIYLVGHSLGVPAILRYLELPSTKGIQGAVLVSGPYEKIERNHLIDNFLEKPFDLTSIKSKVDKIVVIHGDNDPNVPLSHAESLSAGLQGSLVVVPEGGHLNGSSGWTSLPQALEALKSMMK